MKNEAYHYKQIKWKLRSRKNQGANCVIWKLNKEQKDYLEQKGYEIIPVWYYITTKVIPEIIPGFYEEQEKIVKEVSNARKNGKKAIVRKLKREEVNRLLDLGVKIIPCKYKIIL